MKTANRQSPALRHISEGEARVLLNAYWGPGKPPAHYRWSVYQGDDAGVLAYNSHADLIFCFSGQIALLGVLDEPLVEPVQLALFEV